MMICRVGISIRRVHAALPACFLLAVCAFAPKAHGDHSAEQFEKQVRPLLAQRCFACHGAKKQAADLRVDSRAGLLQGGRTGPAIDLDRPGESLLLEAVRDVRGSRVQTPAACKLAEAQITHLAVWLQQGAPWPEQSGPGDPSDQRLWSLEPLSEPPVPDVKDVTWPAGPLDHFVLNRLEAEQLSPAPPADKRTLIRRATFDLTGLPPTPEEVQAFLADDSPAAFARLVDRLLASPRYGERWGRHWLDVARYADSNGLDENLSYANAYHYRDYVVAAFNNDKPYDQFVREQLAGDLMPVPGDRDATLERQIATGFLAIGGKMLAEDDPVKMQMDIVDEQIDTTGKAFLGMTLGCARCHDHKFDPIPTQDYYGLAGIFKSTKTMENFKVVAVWYDRPIADVQTQRAYDAHMAKIDLVKERIAKTARRQSELLATAARKQLADYLLSAAQWNHQQEQFAALKPVVPEHDETPPGVLVVEAENYARGNVDKDFATFGAGIGVLVNRGELPNFAEYDLEVPAGTYQVQFRYAAAESRPVRLSIDGQLVRSDAISGVTGSWTPESQNWAVQGVFAVPEGSRTLRIERDGPFPHIDKLLLFPRDAEDKSLVPKTAEQLATERGINPAFLRQWSQYLERTKDDPGSTLREWHAFERHVSQLLDADQSDAEAAGSPRPDVLAELIPQWRRELAERLQRLYENDETLRGALDGEGGPFAVPDDLEKYFPREAVAELTDRRMLLADLEKRTPALPKAMGVTEGQVQDVPVHLRGSHVNLGEVVPRHFPTALGIREQAPLPADQSGRLQFAHWLTRSDHPLTSRVMVNRIWRWHFGRGLVATPDNFGSTGARPTHPELLDWLARRFVESGWSVKAMHRMIMLSATYQMSAQVTEQAAAADPENNLHWRFNPRRLEAEAIRDAMLSVAGTIDFEMGGTRLKVADHAYVTSSGSSITDEYDTTRRSVYLPVVRSAVYDALETFDFPDPTYPSGDRATTTVAPQALLMLNSPLADEQSAAFARRLLTRTDLDDAGRVRWAYELAYARQPAEEEIARALQFVEMYRHRLSENRADATDITARAWQALCRAIFAANEFVYMN